MTYEIGDPIITDYGSAFVADTREGDDGQEQVGVIIDSALVWVDAETVERVPAAD